MSVTQAQFQAFIERYQRDRVCDAQFQGKVLAGLDNNSEHTIAVSKKADQVRDELNDHKESANAHGIAASEKSGESMFGKWTSIIGLAISILTMIVMLFKFGRGH